MYGVHAVTGHQAEKAAVLSFTLLFHPKMFQGQGENKSTSTAQGCIHGHVERHIHTYVRGNP